MSWKARIKSAPAILKATALRQALVLVLLFNAVMLVSGLTVWLLIKSDLDSRHDQLLQDLSERLAEAIERNGMESVSLPNDATTITLYRDSQGQLHGFKDRRLLQFSGFHDLHIDTLKNDDGLEDDEYWRVYAKDYGEGRLVTAKALDEAEDILEIVEKFILTCSLLISLLTLAGGLLVGMRTQARYNRISSALDAMAEGDLAYRISAKDSADDLDRMAHQIDATTARLESQVDQIKRLSINLAHDLKTPLARLRAKLEQALMNAKGDTEAQIEEALRQNDDVIATFDAILRIARLGTGEHKARFVPLTLCELARETHDIYGSVVEDSGRTLTLVTQGEAQVQGDRKLIIQMLANLLENAMRHTGPGSQIELSVAGRELRVNDNGPGIPEDQRERVLEPMARLDASRSTPGTGLGLAMVKAIADLHSATLSLCATKEGKTTNPGLSVRVVFPADSR